MNSPIILTEETASRVTPESVATVNGKSYIKRHVGNWIGTHGIIRSDRNMAGAKLVHGTITPKAYKAGDVVTTKEARKLPVGTLLRIDLNNALRVVCAGREIFKLDFTGFVSLDSDSQYTIVFINK